VPSSALGGSRAATACLREGGPTKAVGRIRDRSTFQALRRAPQRARSGQVSVAFISGTAPAPRVAYAVTRQVGNAVERNRLRRRLRAAVALVAPELATGAYLVGAGRGAVAVSFEELKDQVRAAMTAAPKVRGR